jgi:phosphate transport system substrate-binding protein
VNDKALNGAGSTLIAPLMAQWQPDYATTAGVTVTYGAVGSGGGIDAITGRTVDFGASDAPLTSDQAKACKGCLLIPWALAGTVVTYNVKGVPNNLKLTGPVVADIFLGNITSWNDSAIAKLNPGVNLPSTHITPIYRSDGSGDSFVFTSYLSKVSPDWSSKVGASTQPSFPTGTGAEHNSGVAADIQSTDGSIGYIAVSYIAADKLNEALIQNAAGNYPQPSPNAIAAAAAAVTTIQPDGSVPLVDPPASAANAYPLSTYSYAIVPKVSPKAAALKKFFTYAISSKGQSFGATLGFPPLPSSIVSHDQTVIGQITT